MPDQEQSTTDSANSRTRMLTTQLAQHLQHERQLRQELLNLSPEELTTIIPHGPYCYTVIAPLPPPAIGHRIAPCPFLIGSRPDTACFLNPFKDYATDIGYNVDACKRCDINTNDSD